MRRRPTRTQRPRGTSATDAADTTPDCIGGDRRICTTSSPRPSGTRLPITPKFKATATARYTWPAWADVKAHVQGSVTYRGSAPSSLRTRSQLVWNRRAGFQNPNEFQGRLARRRPWSTSSPGSIGRSTMSRCSSTNMFDKRIDLSRTTACGSCTRALVVPGRPRTIGIQDGREVLAIGAACNAPRCSGFDGAMTAPRPLAVAVRFIGALIALAAIWLAMLLWGAGPLDRAIYEALYAGQSAGAASPIARVLHGAWRTDGADRRELRRCALAVVRGPSPSAPRAASRSRCSGARSASFRNIGSRASAPRSRAASRRREDVVLPERPCDQLDDLLPDARARC